MTIILWVILGAFVGWIASVIMNTNVRQRAMANVLVGILGSLIGGLIFNIFSETGVTGFSQYSLLVAVLGAVVLLGGLKLIGGYR